MHLRMDYHHLAMEDVPVNLNLHIQWDAVVKQMKVGGEDNALAQIGA